jgi:hypothetical protein
MNMKKPLLTLLAATMLATGISHAQNPVKRYGVSYSGSTYTPLTGATDLGFTGNWDDTTSANITFPFPFKYQNTTVNTFAINNTGSIYLNGVESDYTYLGQIGGINLPYEGRGRGKVKYATTGTTGNRIFKIEFSNVSWANDINGTDTFNFQVWMYEQNHAIEYRAGYSNVANTMFATTAAEVLYEGKEPIACALLGNPGDSIGTNFQQQFIHAAQYKFISSEFTDTAVLLSEMSFDNPEFDMAALDAVIYGYYPTNGSVIRFVPLNPNSIAKIDFDMASIYPNPSKNGQFRMQLKEAPKAGATLTVYDMTGKVVLQQAIHQTTSHIDLAAYANGHYFGKIMNGDRIGSFKLIKE